MDWAGRNILVLGLGESGLAMARWCAYCGARVCVADTRENPERLKILREELPQAEFRGGAFSAEGLDAFQVIAVSPGLRPDTELKEILPYAAARKIPVCSEIELFAQALKALEKEKAYKPAVIAVTGTNGKTTTTSLTGHMCRRAGKTVRMAGNISPAALDVLLEDVKNNTLPDVWVLELSSFQLYTTETLMPDAATVLNVTQDHLDWHGGMVAYAAAKAKVFGKNTVMVLNRDDSIVMKMRKAGSRVLTFGTDEPSGAGSFGLHADRGVEWLSVKEAASDAPKKGRRAAAEEEPQLQLLMPAEDLKIRGRHNASNALAALALCRAVGLPFAPLLHALRDYRGEPHRVELVSTVKNVAYIDDSKGTNVGATLAAVNGLGGKEKNIILIAGGLGKDQDFSPLLPAVSRYVKAVMLIGRDAKIIHSALEPSGAEMVFCRTLEEAVEKSAAAASQNDMVLLSPACASMDMFRSYKHRSDVFIDCVRRLEKAAEGGKA